MITVLSPAKKLSKECNAQNTTTTLPEFLDDSKHLVSILKDSKPGDLQSLMGICLLYTSPSPRDGLLSRMPSSA